MSHPYHHAVSSLRLFGGTAEDYMAVHHWFDATKIAIADQRHRAFRHHEEAFDNLAATLRASSITNKDGTEVTLAAIGRQHLKEDFGGYVPMLADWVETIALRPWMKLNATKEQAATMNCMRRYGGGANDYAQLVEWFFEGTTDDPRSFFHRGHAIACFWAEEVFGATFTLSTSKVLPTRLAAEAIVASMFETRMIPSPQDWVRAATRPDWQGQPRLMAA